MLQCLTQPRRLLRNVIGGAQGLEVSGVSGDPSVTELSASPCFFVNFRPGTFSLEASKVVVVIS